MDPITFLAAAALSATILQGNHQADGYRGTGCDAAEQVAIRSERTGEVLYYNNPTCPAGSGATDVAHAAPEEPESGDNGNGNGKGRH